MKIDMNELKELVRDTIREAMTEVSPPGWKGTVKAMKKHPEDIDNVFALAWSMKNKGDEPHYKNKEGEPEKKEKFAEDESLNSMTESGKKWMQQATKPREKGAFTKKAQKAGDTVQAHADKVLKKAREKPGSVDTKTINQAKFAKAVKSIQKEEKVVQMTTEEFTKMLKEAVQKSLAEALLKGK